MRLRLRWGPHLLSRGTYWNGTTSQIITDSTPPCINNIRAKVDAKRTKGADIQQEAGAVGGSKGLVNFPYPSVQRDHDSWGCQITNTDRREAWGVTYTPKWTST